MVLQLMVKRHPFHISVLTIFSTSSSPASASTTTRSTAPDQHLQHERPNQTAAAYCYTPGALVFEAIFICMERVTILHDEFASGQTGSNFIPELGLNFVEVKGQLPMNHVTRNCRDHFFMRWPQSQFSLLPVCEGEHNALSLGVGIPATGSP